MANANPAPSKFAVYVNPARGHAGFLADAPLNDRLTAWRDQATKYDTIDQAKAAIDRRGWLNQPGVREGYTTAYVCWGGDA